MIVVTPVVTILESVATGVTEISIDSRTSIFAAVLKRTAHFFAIKYSGNSPKNRYAGKVRTPSVAVLY